MYGGCHKISQVCCGINLKFEQIWRSFSSIHLPDFCDAISSPFCYSDAMGRHISPTCGVPVTSGRWKEERYPRTQSPSHHSVGFLYRLAKEVLGCWESKIIEKTPWYYDTFVGAVSICVCYYLKSFVAYRNTMLSMYRYGCCSIRLIIINQHEIPKHVSLSNNNLNHCLVPPHFP